MQTMGNYILNPETLLYEQKNVPTRQKVLKWVLLFALSVVLAFVYAWFLTSVLKADLPKTAILKAEQARWNSKIDIMNSKLDRYEETLDLLRVRDDEVYRSIFGMNEIPAAVRDAGIGGVDRYSYLDGLESDNLLKNTTMRLDRLTRQTCVQSQSFDEVAQVSKTVGDMASCIPAIPPVMPDPSKYRFTSNFGYRSDPFTGKQKMHTGVDFAMKIGNPVYATGDGVVESVDFEFFGYGNSVTINHGFGYKTMYAHLNTVKVIEGMKIKRGECIAESGKSGRSSGPHLHYEVIYKGNKVNPSNYFDLSMSADDYAAMVSQRKEESSRGRKDFVVTSR